MMGSIASNSHRALIRRSWIGDMDRDRIQISESGIGSGN